MRIRVSIAILALGALACPSQELPPPPQSLTAPAREDLPFASQEELVRAIADGTFAERAGLTEAVEAAAAPPEPPPPVKIEFVSGTDVPADQQDELRELAERLKGDDRLVVDLIGCSDPSGPAGLNKRISDSRARSVAAWLREQGVAEGRIGEVVGRGEECEVQERAVNAVLRFSQQEPEAAEAAGAETTADG
jgi:outer membrane protein OmpA-like peptidoglycan-associated protein